MTNIFPFLCLFIYLTIAVSLWLHFLLTKATSLFSLILVVLSAEIFKNGDKFAIYEDFIIIQSINNCLLSSINLCFEVAGGTLINDVSQNEDSQPHPTLSPIQYDILKNYYNLWCELWWNFTMGQVSKPRLISKPSLWRVATRHKLGFDINLGFDTWPIVKFHHNSHHKL